MKNLSNEAYRKGYNYFFINGPDDMDNPFDIMDNRHYDYKQGWTDAYDEAMEEYRSELAAEQREQLFGFNNLW